MHEESVNPNIIFEDDSVFVIEKPAGLIVNRADTTAHVTTLQDWIDTRFGFQRKNGSQEEISDDESNGSDFFSRSGIVHRLDKDTSGLMIVSKTPEAFKNLQAQFKAGTVTKVYKALTHGRVVPEEGVIDAPIGRLPWNRMRFGVFPQGRESKTLYRVEEYHMLKEKKIEEILSFVTAFPKTGRTHQIRVHFLYLGHPLFGDSLYAGRKTIRRDRHYISRHFLHAAEISFDHPVSGERLTFSSKLPEELRRVLQQFPIV